MVAFLCAASAPHAPSPRGDPPLALHAWLIAQMPGLAQVEPFWVLAITLTLAGLTLGLMWHLVDTLLMWLHWLCAPDGWRSYRASLAATHAERQRPARERLAHAPPAPRRPPPLARLAGRSPVALLAPSLRAAWARWKAR